MTQILKRILGHRSSVSAVGDPARSAGGFRLVRYFTVASLGAFLLVAGALLYFEGLEGEFFKKVQQAQSEFFRSVQDGFARRQDEAARRDLLQVNEAGNVNLTRFFANALWERDFAPFVARAQQISIEHCRAAQGAPASSFDRKACFSDIGKGIMALPEFRALDAKVFAAMKGTTVFKIKVFDPRGITVYSSEHAQIGEDKSGNAGWQRAMAGTAASELTHRDKFSAFEGVVENRDLISSYLPLHAPGSEKTVGVFEVYSDVTPFLDQIKQTSAEIRKLAAENDARVAKAASEDRDKVDDNARLLLAVVFGLLALLWVVLFLIVRNGQRIIDRQERDRTHVHQRLAQSEKMAALGQMVAGVAHQLNTPLAFSRSNVSLVLEQIKAIDTPVRVASKVSEIAKRTQGGRVVLDLSRARAQLEAIQTRPEDIGAMQEMLNDVLQGLEQMSELVVHMRDFTRLDRANVADFDVNRGLRSVVYIAKSVIPNRIRVLEEYGDVPEVRCSPSQLNQVFLNLITNAAQAIEGDGTIAVRSRVAGDRVSVEIADSGPGIAPEVLPHIFDSYFTTKAAGEGTGLGLAIALDIVRGHGGDIEVATKIGAGSSFTVWLPLSQPLAKAA